MAEDKREKVDIKALNTLISEITSRQSTLKEEIDSIVADLEDAKK